MSDPAKCPLCKVALSDDATRLAEGILGVLREAKLNRAESDALSNSLIQHYEERSSHQDTVKAIEATVPKAAGLKRFIPPGDVTGALALIIAILTFANEFVFDWVAPNISRSGGETAGQAPPSQEGSRWIKITSLTPQLEPPTRQRPEGQLLDWTMRGSWGGASGDRLYYIIFRNTVDTSNRYSEISSHPGSWKIPNLAFRGILWAREVEALYISTPQHSDFYMGDRLNTQIARATAMLPFKLDYGGNAPMDLHVKTISIGELLDWYNSTG